MHFLIVDDFHPSIFGMLETESWTYDYQPGIEREGIIKALSLFDGLLIRSKTQVDDDLLQNADRLKVIGRAGSGIENIDIGATGIRGIKVFNAPEGNRDAVGDHTVGLILGLTKNIVKSGREVNDNFWNRETNRGVELNAITVGIIGYGNTGSAVGERLGSFGCRILAHDKYKSGFGSETVTEAELSYLLANSDIISLHLPLTEETRYFLSEATIQKIHHPFYLINTSRGEILDTKALMKGLISGKILGAGLDVMENEKINNLEAEEQETFDFLRNSTNVILTPHIAGWTKESHIKINQILIEKIKLSYSEKH